jgi:hypothetical protein
MQEIIPSFFRRRAEEGAGENEEDYSLQGIENPSGSF